jgi:hypothetical protein
MEQTRELLSGRVIECESREKNTGESTEQPQDSQEMEALL